MSNYKNIEQYILTYPLSLLSRWVPKSKRIWLFGSWSGTQYNDNSKYLFRHVNEHCSDVRAVWITRSKDCLRGIKKEGYECYLMYSLSGIIFTLRASVAIISRAKAEDLPIYISPYATKIIQLWHGTPLKKLGRDKKNNAPSSKNIFFLSAKKIIRRFFLPQSNNNYSIFISSSAEVGELLTSAYGNWMKPGAIKVTGYPRNDELHKTLTEKKYKKGIYLPTFRDWDRNGEQLFKDYGFDAKKLNTKLGELGVLLDLKLHPETVLPENVKNDLSSADNISFVTFTDIYEHLGEYDFIITDYSSIYFDFLVLDRPIIFAPFDLEQYVSGRGLYFNYHEVTPGIKAYSWGEVVDAVDTVVNGLDEFKEARKGVNARVNAFNDANNCLRVVAEIQKII